MSFGLPPNVAVYGQKIGEMGLEKCPAGYATLTVDAHGKVEQVCCPHGLEPRPVGTDKYGCFATEETPLPEWVQEAMKKKPPPAAGTYLAVPAPRTMLIITGIAGGAALMAVSYAFYKAFRGRRSR